MKKRVALKWNFRTYCSLYLQVWSYLQVFTKILESYHQLDDLGFQSLFCLPNIQLPVLWAIHLNSKRHFMSYLHYSVSAYRVTNIMWHYGEYYFIAFSRRATLSIFGASGLEKHFLFNFSVLFRKYWWRLNLE